MPTEPPAATATDATPTDAPRKPLSWLVVALALAALIQIIVAVRSPVISTDGVVFIDMARAMREAPAATIRGADQHPGYPAMIIAIWNLLRPFMASSAVETWVVAARLASGLCGLLCIVVMWRLAERVFDWRIAAVSVAIVAVLPLFRENASDALSDSPHLLFYLLAVWLAAEGFVRKKALWFALAGAACALAYWIRPAGLTIAMVTAILLVVRAVRSPQRRQALVSLAALVVAVVAVGSPYFCLKGRLTSKKGVLELLGFKESTDRPGPRPAPGKAPAPPRPQPADTNRTDTTPAPSSPAIAKPRPDQPKPTPPPGSELARAAPPKPPAEPARPPAVRKRKHRVKIKPRHVAIALFDKFSKGLRFFLLLPLAVGLLVPGVRKAQREPRIIATCVCLVHLALVALLYSKFKYSSGRHIMAFCALLMPWIASGTIEIAGALSRWLSRRWGRFTPDWVLVVLVAVMVASLFPRAIRPMRQKRITIMQAARWIRAHADEGDSIMSNTEYAHFYAELPGVLLVSKDRMAKVVKKHPESNLRFVLLDVGAKSYSKRWHLKLRKKHSYEWVHLPGITEKPSRARILQKRQE